MEDQSLNFIKYTTLRLKRGKTTLKFTIISKKKFTKKKIHITVIYKIINPQNKNKHQFYKLDMYIWMLKS